MFKLLTRFASLCLLLPALAFGQVTPTPNIGLSLVPYATANWNTYVNANSTLLDLLLSGNQPLPALSVTGNFTAPGLTTWNTLTTYSLGSVVFYQGTLHQSLIASNTGNVPSTSPSDWSASFSGMVYPASGIACSTGSAWCASYPLSTFLQAANNLSDLGSAASARTNLGLGTAATQASSAFDAAGAAATAQAAAEAFASNASNLSSGTVSAGLLPADVAKTDAANSFSQPQTFTDGVTTNSLAVGSFGLNLNGAWTNFTFYGGAYLAQFGSYYNIPTSGMWSWSTAPDGGPDTTLNRIAAGVVGVGTGNNPPDASGAIEAAFHTTGVGAQITAAATIAPTNQIQHITGTTTVETITVPTLVTAGWKLSLIADAAGVNFGTTGNVAVATTLVQNQQLDLTWDGTKFYPASSGGSSPIFTHTLSGATPAVAVNSASVPATDQNYLPLSANVTSFTLPASTAVANGEIVRVTVQQGATTAYTLPTGTANSPFTAGSGTTLINSVPGGCPAIGTVTSSTAPSELFVSLAYNSALTQWSILGCQASSPTAGAPWQPLSAVGTFGTYPVGAVIAIGNPTYSGHFTTLSITTTLPSGSCATPPTLNIYDGTSHTGTALTASATTQTYGNATSVSQTLTYVAGDNVGIFVSSAGASCTTAIFAVSAQ